MKLDEQKKLKKCEDFLVKNKEDLISCIIAAEFESRIGEESAKRLIRELKNLTQK